MWSCGALKPGTLQMTEGTSSSSQFASGLAEEAGSSWRNSAFLRWLFFDMSVPISFFFFKKKRHYIQVNFTDTSENQNPAISRHFCVRFNLTVSNVNYSRCSHWLLTLFISLMWFLVTHRILPNNNSSSFHVDIIARWQHNCDLSNVISKYQIMRFFFRCGG